MVMNKTFFFECYSFLFVSELVELPRFIFYF